MEVTTIGLDIAKSVFQLHRAEALTQLGGMRGDMPRD